MNTQVSNRRLMANRKETRYAPGISALERDLAVPSFLGVSIGATLTDLLAQIGFQDPGTIIDGAVNYVRCAVQWAVGRPGRRAFPVLPRNRVLFTWMNIRDYCADFVLPVLERVGTERCNVLGADFRMRSRLLPETGFCTWDEIPKVATESWRREYRRCALPWFKSLAGFINENGMPARLLPRLLHSLLYSSQEISALRVFLARIAPSAVVTEYDRNQHTSCLVLAAKSLGIPAMTMIHGVINGPGGYTPLLADRAFCWGRLHYDQMTALGTAPDRLVITGCQRITREISADRRESRQKVGLPADKPVVLLATNPVSRAERTGFVEAFCRAFSNAGNVSAVVRLHPSEELSFYAKQSRGFRQIRFLENASWSLDEAMAATDIVVCRDSGLGNDALIKGRLAVVLDLMNGAPGNGLVLVEKAGCPLVESPGELLAVVNSILSDEPYCGNLHLRAEQFVRYMCSSFDREAAGRVAGEIVGRLKRNGS